MKQRRRTFHPKKNNELVAKYDYDTNSHQNNNDSTKHHNDNAKEEFTAKQNDKKNGNIDLNQNDKNEKGINNNQKNDTKDGEFDGPYIYTDDSVSMIR